MRSHSKIVVPLAVFLISCIISLPWFFDTYRLMAFNTVPRDDYAPFLLHFTTGHGAWPGSPFGYRVLSVLPAVPLYWILPLYAFTLLPNVDASYLKAVEALAFLSYLSIAGSSTIAFEILRNRLGGTISEAGFIATLTIILSGFTGRFGIESFAVFVIFILLYIFERPASFGLVLMLTPFINEKIPMFFLFLTISRSMFLPGFLFSHRWQTGSSIAACGVYVAALMILRLPGNEFQTSVRHWMPQIVDMVATSFTSFKAIDLNILPVFIITIPCIVFSLFSSKSTGILARSDFVIPLGLFVAALAGTYGVTVGRVVALALPLTVISCAILVSEYDRRLEHSG